MKNTVRKIAWGLFLTGAAALVILNAYYDFTDFWPLLCGLVLAPVIIESLVHLSFTGVFMPAALICIVFAKELRLEALTPWPVLAAAVLLSIGFSVIFHSKDKWFGKFNFEDNATTEDIADDEMTCNVKFGESTKFIRSENFEKASLNCKFGGIKAYFDNAKLSPNGARLHINAKFSGIELFIPRHWKIANNVSAFFGGTEEKTRNTPADDSPVLTITGTCRFSGIVIYYI